MFKSVKKNVLDTILLFKAIALLPYCIMDISDFLTEQYEDFCKNAVANYAAKLDKFQMGTVFEMESHLVLFISSLKELRSCLAQENVRI
jgi:hypothetical protein